MAFRHLVDWADLSPSLSIWIEDTRERVENLFDRTRDAFARHRNDIDRAVDRIAALEQRMAAAEERATTAEEKVAALEGQLEKAHERINEVDQELGDQSSWCRELEKCVQRLENEASQPDNAVCHQLSYLQATVDHLDHEYLEQAKCMARWLGKVATLGGRAGKGRDTATTEELLDAAFQGIDAVKARVQAIAVRAHTAASHAAGIATLRRKVEACCRRVATATAPHQQTAAPVATVVAPPVQANPPALAPAPPSASQARPPRCIKCARRGHRASDCRLPRCYECNQYGHLAAQCRAPRGPRQHLPASVQQQRPSAINIVPLPRTRAGGLGNHPNVNTIRATAATTDDRPQAAARFGLGDGRGCRTEMRWVSLG